MHIKNQTENSLTLHHGLKKKIPSVILVSLQFLLNFPSVTTVFLITAVRFLN